MASNNRPIRKTSAWAKLQLAERPGPLKREDVQCPICWSILIEPVTLPCKHTLCLICFKRQMDETSLHCPCCRMRLSVWSRKASKGNNLVNKKLWNRIQEEFPKLVQTRLNGEDSMYLHPKDLVSVLQSPKPGEIRLNDVESTNLQPECVVSALPSPKPMQTQLNDVESGNLHPKDIVSVLQSPKSGQTGLNEDDSINLQPEDKVSVCEKLFSEDEDSDSSPESMDLDFEEIALHGEAFEECRARVLIEIQDRALAKRLQRDFDLIDEDYREEPIITRGVTKRLSESQADSNCSLTPGFSFSKTCRW